MAISDVRYNHFPIYFKCLSSNLWWISLMFYSLVSCIIDSIVDGTGGIAIACAGGMVIGCNELGDSTKFIINPYIPFLKRRWSAELYDLIADATALPTDAASSVYLFWGNKWY